MNFEIQRFASDYSTNPFDRKFTGRRRIAGNYGRLYITDNSGSTSAVFEVNAFNAKVVADREDVIVGISKDSKVVSLTGEGEFTVKYVYDHGFTTMVNDWKKGHDTRVTLIGEISDPDAIGNGVEKVKIVDCWFNEMDLMNFEKGSVVERTIPFGFAPELVNIEKSIGYSVKGTDMSQTELSEKVTGV